ncbi:hypothetical protein LPJ73_005097 [Coemansia sp. RSA 2703]|nr:hypothetical protein LPJ73_005100 [Coemansia sp. RSA 2703]KAJ1844661.1 hypothetical protein LPJ73_005097 [Coemansia sp. RSA 2703]KAJ2370584.1 hypothetical protein IW150_004903 [Coemansia sp. RSA 2607]KAJ2390179.1 hypothetical protein GGI05_003289 [Coemansia sp. RSA 2603]
MNLIDDSEQVNGKFTQPMSFEEAEEFKRLQSMAYEYDSYLLPLFPSLYALAPQSTKISQLECIPIIGNLAVFYIICKFIIRASSIGSIGGNTTLYMFGYAFFMLITGFIPFANVWIAYNMRPLYKCWQILSAEVDKRGLYYGVSKTGMRTEYAASVLASSNLYHLASPSTGNTQLQGIPYEISNPAIHGSPAKNKEMKHMSDEMVYREKRGYSSFIPVRDYGKQPPKSIIADSEYDDYSTRRHSFDSMRASTVPSEADFLKKGYSIRQSHLDNWPLK